MHLKRGSSYSLSACLQVIKLIVQLYSSQPATRTDAARALMERGKRSAADAAAIALAGGIPVLVQLLRESSSSSSSGSGSASNRVVGYAAGALMALAAGSEANQAAIWQAGAVPVLMELLTSSADVTVLANTVTALQNLLSGPNSIHTRRAAVPLLVRALSNSSSEVQESAAAALTALIKQDIVCASAMVEKGGIPTLVKLLSSRSSSEATLRNTAAVVHALAALVECPAYQGYICKTGGIEALVKLLSTKDAATQVHVLGALRRLAKGSETHIQAVAAAGGVPQLVKLLGASQYELQESAAVVLSNLATSSSLQVQIVQAGAGEPLQALLEGGDSQLQRLAAAAVANLGCDVRNSVSLLSCETALHKLRLSQNDQVAAQARRALANLTVAKASTR